jgi:hypothetical protein
MSASGSIEIPIAAEWSQLRKDKAALRERLARLDSERGRVSDAVIDRVRADYEHRAADLEARAQDLAERARREMTSLASAVVRQEKVVAEYRTALEEYDLRERLGEVLDPESTRQAKELRGELSRLEEDLRAMVDLRDRVTTIAEGRSSGLHLVPSPPPPAANVQDEVLAPLPSAALAILPPPAANPRLIPVESVDGTDFFPLGDKSVVGRNPDSDLQLPVGTVSRRHAEVERVEDGWMVRDLHSENGTWVNGERIWERRIVDGDEVQFGTVRLLFRAR